MDPLRRARPSDRLGVDAEAKLPGVGVAALYLFGSHAQNEARADSDVDVLVDPVSVPARRDDF